MRKPGLPMVMQLINNRASVQIQLGMIPKPKLLPLYQLIYPLRINKNY
jgi:hypothetical protein